jgi:uncharacterized membrane protein (GlpM family)
MLELLARFAIGAGVVGLAVWISDNVDARVGGVVSAIPKTSAVSLFVIAYEHGGSFAAETAVSSMFGLVAVIAYAAAFALIPRALDDASLGLVLPAALCVYGLVIGPYLAGLVRSGLIVNLALVAATYLAATLGLARARENRRDGVQASTPATSTRAYLFRYALPAIVGGTLVLATTLAADLLGPVVGGVASVFPANVTTVLVTGSILLEPRAAFDQAAGVPDGVLGAAAFVLGMHALLPQVAPWLAGLAGYLAWAATAWGVGRLQAVRKSLAARA